MRNKFRFWWILGVCIAAFRAEAYTLMCRGPMEIVPAHERAIFAKSSRVASVTGSNLGLGECSWLDRLITAGEPTQIIIGRPVPLGIDLSDPLPLRDLYYLLLADMDRMNQVRQVLDFFSRSDYAVSLDVIAGGSSGSENWAFYAYYSPKLKAFSLR